MEEKHLIKQLHSLKEIKPNSDWVSFLKKEIISERETNESRWDWLFQPLSSSALSLAFRGAMVLMVLVSGVYFYMYHLNAGEKVIPSVVLKLTKTVDNTDEVLKSLEFIKNDLDDINVSLVKLKESNDLKHALAMTEVIKGTAQRGKDALKDIREKNAASSEILASLDAVENTLDSLTEDSRNTQREMIEKYIKDLENRELSDEDERRLVIAKNYYNEGQETEAMILLVKIGEN